MSYKHLLAGAMMMYAPFMENMIETELERVRLRSEYAKTKHMPRKKKKKVRKYLKNKWEILSIQSIL